MASTSIKLKNNLYWDSTSITHNHWFLSSYMNGNRPIMAPLYANELHTKNLITGWYGAGFNSDTLVFSSSNTALCSNLIPVDFTLNGTYVFSGLPLNASSYYFVGLNANFQSVARTSAVVKGSQTSTTYSLTQSKINNKATGASGPIKYVAIEFYSIDTSYTQTTLWQLVENTVQCEIKESSSFVLGQETGYRCGQVCVNGASDNTYWIKFNNGLLIQGGVATFSSGGTTADDSWKQVYFPIPYLTNSFPTIVANPAYLNAASVGKQNILYTNIIPTPSIKNYCTFYRRYSYLGPQGDHTPLYSSPLSFTWIAIGKWK